jgi:hypothetical protein
MADRREFPYVTVRNARGEAGLRPMLPIKLRYGDNERDEIGLLDTGADVNVLPYRLGLALGAIWDDQQTAVVLSGNLANYEARGILLEGVVADFPVVQLAFAWTRSEDVPLLLGQVNFFTAFDVCFLRARGVFEVGIAAT